MKKIKPMYQMLALASAAVIMLASCGGGSDSPSDSEDKKASNPVTQVPTAKPKPSDDSSSDSSGASETKTLEVIKTIIKEQNQLALNNYEATDSKGNSIKTIFPAVYEEKNKKVQIKSGINSFGLEEKSRVITNEVVEITYPESVINEKDRIKVVFSMKNEKKVEKVYQFYEDVLILDPAKKGFYMESIPFKINGKKIEFYVYQKPKQNKIKFAIFEEK